MKTKPRFIVDAPERYRQLEKALSAKARFEPSILYVTADADDVAIYRVAESHDRHILTQNLKDFKRIRRSKPQSRVGLIGFSPQTTTVDLIEMLRQELQSKKTHQEYERATIFLINQQ